MKLANRVKPLSYLKANAPEVIGGLAEHGEPVIITLRGEAKAVLQDVASYEQTQESLALLKILALSNKSAAQGKIKPAGAAFKSIRRKLAK